MKDRDFIYWLQGFFEIDNPTTINEEQTKMIKDHLQKVFVYERTEALRLQYEKEGYSGYSC
jgi:hypothetical protein